MVFKEIYDTDVPACSEVIRKAFTTVALQFGITRENFPYDDGMFMTSEALASEKQQPGKAMYALHLNGQIIGFVTITDKGNSIFGIGHLAVLPEYRRLGYGKALLNFAKAKIVQAGGTKIMIGIIEENAVLKAWYEQYGFISTGADIFPDLPFTVGYMELDLITQTGFCKRKIYFGGQI